MKKVHTRTLLLYKQLLQYVKPFWFILFCGVLANILYSCIDAGFTYLMRPFLDKGLIEIDKVFIRQIPLIILVGIIIRGCVSSIGAYCMTWVARSVVKVLRQRVFAHILELPAAYYDKASSGELLSKLLYDVEQVAQVSADALTDFVQNTCLVLGLLTVMMLINWQLSLMFLMTVPFIGLIVNYTNKKVRKSSHRVQESMNRVTEIVSESIDGYRVVRIFGGKVYEKNKFNDATEQSRKNDMRVAMSKAINVSGVQSVIAIGIASIIVAAVHLAEVVEITPGSFLTIIAAMLQLIKPMKTLTTLNAVIQRGLAGAESVFELLSKPLESKQGALLPKDIKGEIIFDKVSYAYQPGQPVLNNITFQMKAGETIALIGKSGSGKSTLASLLPRFYDASSGSITIDGIPITTVSLDSLRSHISLVSQHITLFNDSIAKNIAYGDINASREDVMQAAKLAFAEEFINKLPQGYDTIIGENGILLSGGQRQRLAIARAILKQAPILILDEATSSLDNESEQFIQLALETVMKGKTTLVIAHRLSTIQGADKIIVLHEGEIIEQGRHHELLSLKEGKYAQLFNTQQVNLEHEEPIFSYP